MSMTIKPIELLLLKKLYLLNILLLFFKKGCSQKLLIKIHNFWKNQFCKDVIIFIQVGIIWWPMQKKKKKSLNISQAWQVSVWSYCSFVKHSFFLSLSLGFCYLLKCCSHVARPCRTFFAVFSRFHNFDDFCAGQHDLANNVVTTRLGE